ALRYDARELEPAGFAVEARAVSLDMITVAQRRHCRRAQETQKLLAGAEPRAPQVPAVEVEQIEGDENDVLVLAVRQRALEPRAVADAVLVEDDGDPVEERGFAGQRAKRGDERR